MRRAGPALALCAALLGACRGEAEPAEAPAANATPAEAPAPARPPEPACDAEAPLPPLPAFAAEAKEGEAGFRVEPIATPRRGECVSPRALLSVGEQGGPLHGAVRGEGEARRFALPEVRDVAPLGEGFFLSAGEGGLFLHDAATMSRRARLYDAPLRAVATSPDRARIAVLGRDGRLSVVALEGLRLLAQREDVGAGRLAFGAEGEGVLSLEGQRLTWLPLDGGAAVERQLERSASDAVALPGHPGLVALADGGPAPRVYDLREGGYRPTQPMKKLGSWGDVTALAARGEALYAGDEDGRVHFVEGLLGEAPEERRVRRASGSVAALALSEAGALAAATHTGQLVLSVGGAARARLHPLVVGLLGGEARLAWVGPEAVVVAFLGELFRFDGAAQLLRAADGLGHVVAQHAGEADLVVAVRVGARTYIYRVEGPARPAAEAAPVGSLRWADVLGVLRADDGSRLLLGLTSRGVDAAFLEPGGQLVTMGQPAMQLRRPVSSAEVGDGRYALWDPEGQVYEVDVRAQSFVKVGSFLPTPGRTATLRLHPTRGYEALVGGRRQALVPAVPEAPAAPATPTTP